MYWREPFICGFLGEVKSFIFKMLSSSSSSENLTEESSSLNEAKSFSQKGSMDGKYHWTADLIWRNRSFKDLHVFYDHIAGQLGFCKSKNHPPIYSSKENLFRPSNILFIS